MNVVDRSAPPPRPRRIIPLLAPLYDALTPLTVPMIRLTAGLLLLPHGCQKLFGWFGGKGMAGTAAYFASAGFEPGYFWALLVALTETVGGLCLAVGFLTRPAAAAIAVFMAVAVIETHWPKGFFWTSGGFEYPLMWGIVALAFVIRGGGRYSVDGVIGREF